MALEIMVAFAKIAKKKIVAYVRIVVAKRKIMQQEIDLRPLTCVILYCRIPPITTISAAYTHDEYEAKRNGSPKRSISPMRMSSVFRKSFPKRRWNM